MVDRGRYYILYDPSCFDFMNAACDGAAAPADLVGYVTGRNPAGLSADVWLQYLVFNAAQRRPEWGETFGMHTGAAAYIANQLGRLVPEVRVLHAYDRTATLLDEVTAQGQAPRTVFAAWVGGTLPTVVSSAQVQLHNSESSDKVNSRCSEGATRSRHWGCHPASSR